jgi:hypothetical protein
MKTDRNRPQRDSATLIAPILVGLGLWGCGYSQDEWDAQLAKSEQLQQQLLVCQSSKSSAEASPTTKDAESCVVDKDCSGELICDGGRCRQPKR